jgi:arsenate reductase-like glutaredoxin family protein
MIKDIDEIFATKARSVIYLDLKKDRPSRELLLRVLIGRTGNLRAPALRKGRTLIVGFEEAMYQEVFGKQTSIERREAP